MFSILRHKLAAYRYKSNDLNIIQDINADKFSQIIAQYHSQGWEKTDAFRPFSADDKKWTCKLRKGSQILQCVWRRENAGSISGMSRIIQSIGRQYSLDVRQSPSKG